MKKYLLILLSLFLLVGCSFNDNPKTATETLLKKYQSLDNAVVDDLNLTAEGMTFSDDKQKEDYLKAIKMQYSDLKYEIIDEEVDGDEAEVEVKISVYDFYKVEKEADKYKEEHVDDFMNEETFDNDKFVSYKIKQMMDASDRVEYTINVNLEKVDNKWKAKNFDKTTLEKIHGTYNYENE